MTDMEREFAERWDKRKAYMREYNKKNRERINEHRRRYRHRKYMQSSEPVPGGFVPGAEY